MKAKNVVRVLMTTGAATALGALAFAAPARATSASPVADPAGVAIVCPAGDVCFQLTDGTTVVAPGGKGSYNPPLDVDLIDNDTSTTSCVETGLIVYRAVPAHTGVSGHWPTVYGVTPGPVCPG